MKNKRLALFIVMYLKITCLFSQGMLLEKDISFGKNGSISICDTNIEYPDIIAIQQDNSILIAETGDAYYESYRPYLLKIYTNGNIDMNFKFQLDTASQLKEINRIIVKNNLTYLLGFGKTDHIYPVLVKLNEYGQLDTTFNSTGFVSFPQDEVTNLLDFGIASTDSGKIIFTYMDDWYIPSGKLTLRAINDDGTIDTKYKSRLLEHTDSINEKNFLLYSAKITPDNKLLVVGQYNPGWYCNINYCHPYQGNGLIIKLNLDGTLCKSFGNDGVKIIDNPNVHLFQTVRVLQDLSLLISGRFNLSSITFNHISWSGNVLDTYLSEGYFWTNINQVPSYWDRYEFIQTPKGDELKNMGNYILKFDLRNASLDSILLDSAIRNFTISKNEALYTVSKMKDSCFSISKYNLEPIHSPLYQLSNLNYNWDSCKYLDIKWDIGDADRRLIFISEEDSIFPGLNDRKTYYPSNDWEYKFSEIETSGWYCVFNGTEDSVRVIGMDCDKEYWVVGVECNGSSGWEKYNHNITKDNSIPVLTPVLNNGISIINENYIDVYPNPSKNHFYIHFNTMEPEIVEIININGVVISTYDGINTQTLKINTLNYLPGIYLVKVIFNGKIITKQIVIVE